MEQADQGAGPAGGGPGAGSLPFADQVSTMPVGQVWVWLRQGWNDLRRAGSVSVAYGLMFVLIGFAITGGLVWVGMPYLITPMIGGFLLIGPLLSLGLYDISKRIEEGKPPSFGHALFAWRVNSFQILTAGLVLMLVVMIWARLSVVLFALSFPYESMSLASFLSQMATVDGLVFTVMMVVLGGLFALGAFVTNVVTLPMMLDRRGDVFAAAAVSVAAVAKNPRLCTLWAAVIVGVIGLGFVVGFVGLAVALPLIGHASWHVYRDLVKAPSPQSPRR